MAVNPNFDALVLLGLVIGVLVVLAEPAIHILNRQVEDVTGLVKETEPDENK